MGRLVLHTDFYECARIVLSTKRKYNILEEMSITISNWKQICDASTNRSPSKMAYSFSRARRFKHTKENRSQIFYQTAGKNSRRATSFGYGNKYDFTKDLPSSPPPNTYTLPTQFIESPKKGFNFGQGREEMTVTGPLADTVNNKNPGPGAYEPMKNMAKIGYSMRSKIIPPQPEAERVPGPGTYREGNFFTPDGSVFNSKHPNHKAITFKSGVDRFKRKENTVPGPGNYNTSTTELSREGKYSVSNLQNSKVRSFGHAIRKSFANRCQTPGPGNYKMPSEFGHYASRIRYVQNSEKVRDSS